MKKLLNKIGMFLTKKLHLLFVVCNFKKKSELSDKQIEMIFEKLVKCTADLKEINERLIRLEEETSKGDEWKND